MKKILSLIFSVIFIIGILSGCGNATMDEINKNTNITVATLGDEDIYAYEMIYLMKLGYPKEEALNEIASLKACIAQAKKQGIELDDNDNYLVAEQYEMLAAESESEEAFIKEIENFGITKEQFMEIIRISFLVEKLNGKLEELGLFSEVDDETVLNFYNNNFLRCQHILFSTVDVQTNAKLPDDVIKEKKAKAEETAKKIAAGANFEDFVSLSEDPGLESSPNGYTFLNSRSKSLEGNDMMLVSFQQAGIPIMVEVFEKTTSELETNAVSGVVESDFGFHIIKRYDLHGENNEYEELKPYIAGVINNVNYAGLVDSWKGELKQKTNKYYEALEVTPAAPLTNNQETQPQESTESAE